MAINIRHTYNTYVEIIYYPNGDGACGLHESNFAGADVCSAETGEVLMIIERT